MKFKHSTIIFSAVLILILPLMLFVLFWLNFFWSLLVTSFLIYLAKDFIPYIRSNFNEVLEIKPMSFIFASLLLLAWIIYGGIGKIGYQNFDYIKHNSIYFDLMQTPWPVQTLFENQPYYLVYYFAYYLVPAALGKIFGSYLVLEIASIVQAYLGLSLLLLVLSMISHKKNIFLICLIFIFWAGLDVFGNMIFQQDYSKKFGEFPEWWAGASHFQYTGFTDLLYWVPQHALGGWLSTVLCIFFLQKQQYKIIPFLVGLSLAWSPFVCVGLLPILLVSFARQLDYRAKIEWCLTRYGIFALFFLVVLMGYYSTSSFEQPFRWQFTKMGASEFINRYLVFLALEILIPASFIFYFREKLSQNLKLFFYLTILFLAITPHIYLGVYSDFAMRASIPGLFSLFALILLSIDFGQLNLKMKIACIIFILCIPYSAISDFYRSYSLRHQEMAYGPTKIFDPNGISKQYLGKKDSTYFKLFFKQ
jgi:hypothetical protein